MSVEGCKTFPLPKLSCDPEDVYQKTRAPPCAMEFSHGGSPPEKEAHRLTPQAYGNVTALARGWPHGRAVAGRKGDDRPGVTAAAAESPAEGVPQLARDIEVGGPTQLGMGVLLETRRQLDDNACTLGIAQPRLLGTNAS